VAKLGEEERRTHLSKAIAETEDKSTGDEH